jgi:NAD(P)H-hydrate epimerase
MPARFVSDAGNEVPAVTAAQTCEVDRIAIEETGPNLFQMMENAGSHLAAQALEALGERSREALVVASPCRMSVLVPAQRANRIFAGC